MIRSPITTRRASQRQAGDSSVFSRDDDSSLAFQGSEPDSQGAVNTDNNSGGNSVVVVSTRREPTVSAADPKSGPSGEVTPGKGQGKTKIQKLDGNMYRPFGSRSRASSDAGSDTSLNCKGGPGKVCGEPVRSSECGVSCDRCEKWFHASCQGIPKPAYDALAKFKVLAWLCPACKDSFRGHDDSSLVALESKVEQLSAKVDEHMKRIGQSLKEQEQAVDGQTKLIERSIRDNHAQRASYADMVKGSCTDVVTKVSAKVSAIPQSLAAQTASKDMQSIARVFDDFLEKDKRKNNVVIHNLPEGEGDTSQERLDKDIRLFKEVTKDVFKLNVSISKAYRVGKAMQAKPRLLIVTLDTPGAKGDLLRMAPQLRNSDKWGNIYITPDLTKAERDAARKVREELAARRAAGETNLTIRRGRVVSTEQAAGPSNREGGQSYNMPEAVQGPAPHSEALTACGNRSNDQKAPEHHAPEASVDVQSGSRA